MSSLSYLKLTQEIALIGELFTLEINTFLIWITVFHIKNIKGGYRILVLALANLEILFAFLEFLIKPFIHYYHSSYIYFTIDKLGSKSLQLYLLLFYSGTYSILISLIATQFFYRYCLINRSGSKVISLIDKFWWVYCTFWTVLWILSYYQCAPDKESIDYLRDAMITEYNTDIEEIAGFFIVVYDKKGSLRVNTLITITGLIIVLSFQYMVIIFSSWQIQRNIQKKCSRMSSRIQNMQKQLFKTLILQILIPFFFHHIPGFLHLIGVFLDLDISVPSGVVITFFSFFPSIDSVFMMCLVAEYKVAIRKRFEVWVQQILKWLREFDERDRDEEVTITGAKPMFI